VVVKTEWYRAKRTFFMGEIDVALTQVDIYQTD
jgi:hypothetical protein